MNNPYAPPASDVDAPVPPTPEGTFPGLLFSPRQIAIAAFFGTPMAGIYLLQANYRVMGSPAAANKVSALGLLVSAALLAMLMRFPTSPSLGVNIFAATLLSWIAERTQGEKFRRHVDTGGARGSNWRVLAVVIGTIVAVLAVVYVAGMISGFAAR